MEALVILFTFFAAVESLFAVACVFYAWKNSTALKGARAQYLISASSVLFVLSTISPSIGYLFLSTAAGAKFLAFSIFSIAFFILLAGLIYSGVVVRRVKRISWLSMITVFAHGKYRLLGSSFLLISFPFWLLFLPVPEVYPYGMISQVFLCAGLGGIALGERKLHEIVSKAVLPPKEKLLLKDSLGLLHAYAELTTRLLNVILSISDVKPVREILLECSRRHDVLGDCHIIENRLDCSALVRKVSKMELDEASEKLAPAFSFLNSRLIYLLGALTSRKFAEEKFSHIYYKVKERAGGAEAFSKLALGLPPGFLEDEKLRAASREELGEMVKERTAELEKTVAELRKTERELKESERRYREIVNLLPETVFETDGKGRILFLNPSGQKEFGYSGGLLTRLLLSKLLSKRDWRVLKPALKGARVHREEFVAVRRDGTKFPAIIRFKQITANGKVVGLRGIVVNITAIKKAEEAEKVEVLRRLEDLYNAWKAEKKAVHLPRRIQELQMAAIDTIKRQLIQKNSYIIETYKELLKKKK